MMLPLFPYQARAVRKIKEAWLEGFRRILLVMPTGSGKTRVAADIIETVTQRGRQSLFLAHRRELIAQTSKNLDEIGCTHHGVILAGHTRNHPLFPIQVASVQTINARGESPRAQFIAWDEAHHATADTYQSIGRVYPDALHVGFTATPERGDSTPLGDVWETLITVVSVAELVELGRLVPAHVLAPVERSTSLAEDPVVFYDRKARGRRGIVFCQDVEHARSVTRAFLSAGFPAELITGGTPTEERERAIERFTSGATLLLVNVNVLTEGTDLPCADLVIMARGVSAWSSWIQSIGRGLRAYPGKKDCIIADLRGHVHRFGLPDDPRRFSLNGTASSAVGGLPALATCLACGATFRSKPHCPRCGAKVSLPRDAPKVKRAELIAIERGRTTSHADKLQRFRHLCAEAKAKGWAWKAVGIKFKEEFGEWPKWAIPRGES